MEDMRYLKTKLQAQADRVPLAQRTLLLEQLEIMNAAVTAAYAAGADANITISLEDFQ
jgi:hypothetical protein